MAVKNLGWPPDDGAGHRVWHCQVICNLLHTRVWVMNSSSHGPFTLHLGVKQGLQKIMKGLDPVPEEGVARGELQASRCCLRTRLVSKSHLEDLKDLLSCRRSPPCPRASAGTTPWKKGRKALLMFGLFLGVRGRKLKKLLWIQTSVVQKREGLMFK